MEIIINFDVDLLFIRIFSQEIFMRILLPISLTVDDNSFCYRMKKKQLTTPFIIFNQR